MGALAEDLMLDRGPAPAGGRLTSRGVALTNLGETIEEVPVVPPTVGRETCPRRTV